MEEGGEKARERIRDVFRVKGSQQQFDYFTDHRNGGSRAIRL